MAGLALLSGLRRGELFALRPELRQEALKLRRRVQKLTALLRLALKMRILRAVIERARISRLRAILPVPPCVARSTPCLASAKGCVYAR